MLQQPMETLRGDDVHGQRAPHRYSATKSSRRVCAVVRWATHGLSWRSPFLWPAKTRSWY